MTAVPPDARATLARLTVESPFGDLGIACSERGLVAVTLPNEAHAARPFTTDPDPDAECERAARHAHQAAAELRAYFAGTLRVFSVPFDLHGTPFQLAVWRAVLAVPFGETRTYREIAASLGRPAAVRAVGAANGANPLPIVVPCHRIVGSDGSLTGYGGGLAMKRGLLAHERLVLAQA